MSSNLSADWLPSHLLLRHHHLLQSVHGVGLDRDASLVVCKLFAGNGWRPEQRLTPHTQCSAQRTSSHSGQGSSVSHNTKPYGSCPSHLGCLPFSLVPCLPTLPAGWTTRPHSHLSSHPPTHQVCQRDAGELPDLDVACQQCRVGLAARPQHLLLPGLCLALLGHLAAEQDHHVTNAGLLQQVGSGREKSGDRTQTLQTVWGACGCGMRHMGAAACCTWALSSACACRMMSTAAGADLPAQCSLQPCLQLNDVKDAGQHGAAGGEVPACIAGMR